MTQNLFAGGYLRDQLQAELRQAAGVVAAFDADRLLDRTDDEVLAELMAARAIPRLEILWERAYSPGMQESTVDVQHNLSYGGAGEGRPILIPADEVAVHVPFIGDRDLLFLRPSSFPMMPPQADVNTDEIVFRIKQPRLTSDQVVSAFNGFQASVAGVVATVNTDIDANNRELQAAFRSQVAERRQRLLEQRQQTASLPFLIRPTGAEPTFAVPVRRTRVHLSEARPGRPFEPQYELRDAIYEDILGRIAAAAHQLERTPETFEAFGEESLRNLLLFTLNTVYEGQAGGEVFSRSEKTDIAVTTGGRNVFTAECKIWDGPSKFSDAVDQLLSYLVWRDSKAALVLFIKGGNATEIIEKADAAVAAHAQYARRLDPADAATRIDYVLKSTADEQRLIHTALLPIVIAGRRVAARAEAS